MKIKMKKKKKRVKIERDVIFGVVNHVINFSFIVARSRDDSVNPVAPTLRPTNSWQSEKVVLGARELN